MQVEVPQSAVVPMSLLSFPSSSAMISASFDITQIDTSVSPPTITFVQLNRFSDVHLGSQSTSNVVQVISSLVGQSTVGFNLVLNIPDPENLGWVFADPAGVFPTGTASPRTAGLLISPVSETVINIGFMVSSSQSGEASFSFSLMFRDVNTNDTLLIDDPTVILKPPPPEV